MNGSSDDVTALKQVPISKRTLPSKTDCLASNFSKTNVSGMKVVLKAMAPQLASRAMVPSDQS